MRNNSNRRPDEEGIKTYLPLRRPLSWRIPTADLMKKGLRPLAGADSVDIA